MLPIEESIKSKPLFRILKRGYYFSVLLLPFCDSGFHQFVEAFGVDLLVLEEVFGESVELVAVLGENGLTAVVGGLQLRFDGFVDRVAVDSEYSLPVP